MVVNMNRNSFLNKMLVFTIITLFFCVNFTTCINAFIFNDNEEFNNPIVNSLNSVTSENVACLTFYTFDKTGRKQNKIDLPSDSALEIKNVFDELEYNIVYEPKGIETQELKNSFISLIDEYGLLPEKKSKDDILSLLNPGWLKSDDNNNLRFRDPYSSALTRPFLGAYFGSSVFCSVSSAGSGLVMPLFMLPRPRAIGFWFSYDYSITSVANLFTGRGFLAGGVQGGLLFGFMGIGLTYAVPGVTLYGFIGYSLFVGVTAEFMEFYPPNNSPVILDESPVDGVVDVPLDLGELSFRIEDADGDLMDYQVTTDPDIGSGSGVNKKNGVYKVSISDLNSRTTYKWKVVVFDGKDTVEKTFGFNTVAIEPIVSNPDPMNNSRYVPVSLSHLSITLNDYQGDSMDFTVETSPNIGSSGGNNVGGGTFTCDVSGLDYAIEYKWFVNVTDGVHWTREVFNFQTELKMVFDPFEDGWQYRKQIVIDHNLVFGDLVDFPVLVNTVDLDLRDKAQDDGDDVLFMDGSGVANRLFHEIELFDGSSGELVAWINISSVSSSVNTVFYIYYGNPACCSQQLPEKTWDTNYMLVYHMNDNTETMIKDVTINDNNGIKYGTTYPVESNGKIGHAQYFNGYVSCYMMSSKNIAHGSNPWTYECWYRADSYGHSEDPYPTDPYSMFFSINKGISTNCLQINIAPRNSENRYRCYMDYQAVNGYSYTENLNIFDNQWHHAVVVRDNNASEFKIFIDGFPDYIVITSISSGYTIQTAPLEIGASHSYYPARMYYEGFLDEIRISNIFRSPQWISTSFNNQNDPTSFLSFGVEESPP